MEWRSVAFYTSLIFEVEQGGGQIKIEICIMFTDSSLGMTAYMDRLFCGPPDT